jgi:hypothetical protein
MTAPAPEEVLFEFRKIGPSVRVSAVHVGANVEAAIMGPASAGEAALKWAALQKLAYVMKQTTAPAPTAPQKPGVFI